jgi:DNA-binding response OmpR family regulator
MSADTSFPTCLLVEDDKVLASVLETALSDQGFEVVVAHNGDAAFEELNDQSSNFKAVVTDIRLGKGPDGWNVAHRARELTAGVPIIYMSGDSAADWSAKGVPESVMLQKPFVIAQLMTAVTTLMNAAGSATALSDAMANDSQSEPSSD